MKHEQKRRLGIIGGLGALAGADILFKIVKNMSTQGANGQFDILFEQEPFDDRNTSTVDAAMTERKLYVYRVIRELEDRGVDVVVLPCFISHTFIREIAPEISAQILNVMDAIKKHLATEHPMQKNIGVITSRHVRTQRLFEDALEQHGYHIIHPSEEIQEPGLRDAVYGPKGIKAGNLDNEPVEIFQKACDDVIANGAEIIVPGLTEIPLVQEAINLPDGVSILDCNQIYAEFALRVEAQETTPEYKIGIIGGVGPLATVDFMEKVIKQTSANKDQEHIKMVVEHNPKIPDRTDNLLGDGPDPTIPLLAAAKRLEADNADMIAIPCNTAHAFVERIQRYISIPVVHMIYETACAIRDDFSQCQRIGLLATSGTVQSRVYHQVLEGMNLEVLTPDAANQSNVMNAIYGDQGVKAGHTTGVCVDELMNALNDVVAHGAEAVILGCTELPLLVQATDAFPVNGRSIVILDPTAVMAQRCVSLAQHPIA